MDKFLIVGLGNIGFEYEHTRHNIGFDILDHFVAKHKGVFSMDRLAYTSAISLKGKKIICIKPTTYMNLSGKAVKYWLEKENIDISRMLVLVDELSVPLNKIKIKPSGSDGGHNGLKHTNQILQTTQYARLRFGISAEFSKGQQVDYVLGVWSEEELKTLKEHVERAGKAVLSFGLIGLPRTMNEFNTK